MMKKNLSEPILKSSLIDQKLKRKRGAIAKCELGNWPVPVPFYFKNKFS
jgi:hypothetical protein